MLENDYIDGALTSFLEGETGDWKAIPGVATNKDEVLAGRRQPLHVLRQHAGHRRGPQAGAVKLALVGHELPVVGPAGDVAPQGRQVSKPFVFNIGLLCSKTFDDAIFEELFEAKYGLRKQDMVKMNIKGVFQIWMKDGSYHEINLKECHAWTREGCTTAPTSPPSTPTSRPAASASTTTGR